MPTSGTPQNVSRVESLTEEDPRLAYVGIQDIMQISSGGPCAIFQYCLRLETVLPVRCPITLAKNGNRVG